MATETEAHLDWFQFLEARLQTAVQAAVAAGSDPDDALRGLYISDEQALALAAEGGRPQPSGPLGEAADAAGRDGRETRARRPRQLRAGAVRRSRAAPSLRPSVRVPPGRRHATGWRARGSPPTCWPASGSGAADVLACFGPAAPLSRRGAIRVPPADPTATLADRPVKVADRLTAFLLGAGDLAEAAAGVRLRRRDPQPVSGRDESVQRIAMLLATRTRLPLVVCGPDGGAILAAAAGAPLVLLGRTGARPAGRDRRRPTRRRARRRGCCVSTGSRTSRRPSAHNCCGRSTRVRSGSCCSRRVAATRSR